MSWAVFRGDDVFVSRRFIKTSYGPQGPPWLPKTVPVPDCPTWLGSKWLQRASWVLAKVFVLCFFPSHDEHSPSLREAGAAVQMADICQRNASSYIIWHCSCQRWAVAQQFLSRDETCVRRAKATLKVFSWSHLGGLSGIHASLKPPNPPHMQMKTTTSIIAECFTWSSCPWSSSLCLGNHLISLSFRLQHKSSSNKNWP